MFNGNLSTVQDYRFRPSAIDAPNLQDQGTNGQATHAVNSSKHDHEIYKTEGNGSCSNDTYSSARNAMHISKLFSSKDRKYNGSDDEKYDEFVEQYLAASLELCLSPSERLQYLHNLFHGEALRFYNANVVGCARLFSEALQMMKKQFNSASKQQQVTTDIPKLSNDNFLGKTGGDK